MLHARLTAAPRGLTGSDGATQAHITRALLAVLTSLVEQIKALSEQIDEQLAAHADAHIFTSLPRSGPSAPPGCSPRSATAAPGSPPRSRWPAWPASHPPPDSPARAATSGSAGPATNNSATPSPTSPATPATPTPGPPTSTSDARDRGHDHPHAVRILARAWLYVIWHCWQDGIAYDPDRHGALQRLLAQARSDKAA